MKLKISVSVVCFLGLISVGSHSEAVMRIMCPQEDVWLSSDTLQVVGMLDGEKDAYVSVRVKGGALVGSDKSPVTNGAFNITVKLKKGKNRIIVKSSESKAERTVYLALSKKGIPRGLKRYYLHPPMELPSCNTCHELTGKSASYKKVLPTKANCTDGKCHPQIGKAEYTQGHAEVGKICVFCHNPHGSVLPNEISRAGADLCISCHQEEKKIYDEKVIMPPVRDGNCTVCHDPHQSSQRFLLRGTSQEELCFTCHDRGLKKYAVLHGPIRKGDCIACHTPHSSPYKGLLPEKNTEFCFLCHKDRQQEFQKRYRHKPLEENCNNCHMPHGSNFDFHLKDRQPTLCFSCHQKTHPDVIRQIKFSKVKHGAMKDGKCSSCHTVHSTDFKKQLKARLKDICFTCHKELGDKVASSKYKHGAVQESNCNACHGPHGSSYMKLLLKYYPSEFYTAYTPTAYALCFECHNKDILKYKKTTELTNFRNGSRNLHYLHVVSKKGRTCRACHEVHAGNQPKHIRAEIPFGMWSYSIEFTLKKTGGSCVVGCHKPKSYDRVKEVKH
jgi:predicted CXXCH cytochrome family protein